MKRRPAAAGAPASPASVPLRARLPNAPAHFVGREADLAALEQAVRRGPVAVVCGAGGIGKTSLVLHALHTAFAAQVPRTLYLGVEPGEPTDNVRHRLVHSLVASTGREVDLAALRGEPEAYVAAAIDLAERGPWWVVLDDIHHADADEMGELLCQLAAYARRSRWLATSRAAPRASPLAAQRVELGALSEPALHRLAAACAPAWQPHEVRRAVLAARGSPWLLLQHAAIGADALSVTRAQLLRGLPPESAALLATLALLHAPLPPATLAALVGRAPDEAELGALERRGLVQRVGDAWRAHDVARAVLVPEEGDAAARAAQHARARGLAAQLAALGGEPEAALEALRLYAAQGDVAALEQTLARHGEALLARGSAARVWATLKGQSAPALQRWLRACAAELGNPTALSAVDAPAQADPADWLAWARALLAQGAVADAEHKAALAANQAQRAGDAGVAARAVFLRASCAVHRGLPDKAAQLLAALAPAAAHDAELALRRDALAALCDARHAPERRPPDALAQRARDSASPDPEACLLIAQACHATGDAGTADALLTLALATPRGGQATNLVARQALVLRARIALEAGRLGEAAAALATLRPYARTASFLRPFVLELEAALRLATGELDGLEALVQQAARESEPVDAACAARVAALRAQLASLRGAPAEPLAGAPPWRDPLATRVREARARLARADEPLDAALCAAVDAEQAARAAGRWLAALDAAHGVCDALACSAQWRQLAGAAARLGELGRELGSPRFQLEAALFTAGQDYGALERLAARADAAPVAARRAQALLGARPPLDAVDARVVAALATREGAAAPRRVELVAPSVPGAEHGEAWRPGWGLDERRRCAWLPDGQSVEFESRPLLWRLLLELADRGERGASKEALARTVWAEREYHPLQHDPRLHVAVRKLRELLGDTAASAARVVTTDEGYRLGGEARRARA